MRYPIIDGHVDLIYQMMQKNTVPDFTVMTKGPVTRRKLEKGNVRVVVNALFSPDTTNGEGKSKIYLGKLLEYADTRLSGLTPIRSCDELKSLYRSGSGCGTLFLIENADALLDMDLGILLKRKIRVVGLTHKGRNRIADGNDVANPGGLTSAGKSLVRFLEENRFVIDVAHLSDPSFDDLVSVYQGPVVSSHTGLRRFCPAQRNLDDKHLEVVHERHGIIGLTADPQMLTGNRTASIEDVFRHMDWVVQKYGPEMVALGSDFCGFFGLNKGLEDISKLGKFEEIMRRSGYPEDGIRRIMGENWYDFYRALLA